MNESILKNIEHFLAGKDDRALRKELLNYTPFEIAKIVNQSSRGKRKLFALLPAELQAETVLFLSKKSKKTIIPQLGNPTIARFLHFIDYDSDAVDILQFLSEKRQKEILGHLRPAKRAIIEKLLKYDPNTAGGIMDLDFIIIQSSLSFRDLREEMEQYKKSFNSIPTVILEDENKKIIGYLPLKKLFFTPPEAKIKTLARPLSVVRDNQSDIELIKNIESGEKIFGVMDDNNKLVGIIKIEDLAKISLREATQNLYGFAGVKREEEVFDRPLVSIKMRYRWLMVNLGTAFLAAAVVGLFQDIISKLAILAAYMPVVAGMGGNAGTQTLVVVIRAIALGEVSFKDSWIVLKKEIATALGNGLIIGAIASSAAIFWNANPVLGVILVAAIVINLVVAALFGTLVPLFLKFFKIDPALAASVFITTATDVFGFLAFLGLAKIFLV